jgi:hypothetical protein
MSAKPVPVTRIKEPPSSRSVVEAIQIAKEIDEGHFELLMKNFPAVYFDARDGSYWFQVGKRFLQLKTNSLKAHFLAQKIRAGDGSIWQLSRDGFVKGLNIRQIDWPFYNAETNHVVDYAGELAGHSAGLHTDEANGKVYLITKGPKGVFDELPKEGEPEFFLEFIHELLGEVQAKHFCYWLSFALRSLRARDFKPGQVCFFAGEKQSGKSLLQYIITQVFGGRSASPYKYMFGLTDFNYDLITSEHWMIEDPPTNTDLASRRQFGDRLKECSNNREFRARRMQKDGEMVRIFRRITISINKRIEQLSIIPPLYDGTSDKTNLYNCNRVRKALQRFVVGAEQERLSGFGEAIPIGQMDDEKIRRTIQEELPVLRGWLLRCFKHVPEQFSSDASGDRDYRMSLAAWHDAELFAEVNSLSYEEKMLALFDTVYWIGGSHLWEGRADAFQTYFREKFQAQAERIFRGEMDPATVGRYLAELKRTHPSRISNRKLDGISIWTILPPSKPKDTNASTD